MDQSFSHKIYIFCLYLVSKYLVWITIGIVLILYWFFPETIEVLGSLAIFWGPIIVISAALIISITANIFKFKRHTEQGINQYEIIINKFEIYLADLIIYLGTAAILFSALIFSSTGVNITDLIQALIFYLLASWLKQIFYRQIIQP